MSTISSTDSSTWTSLHTQLAATDTNADGIVSKNELVEAASEDSTLASAFVSAADSDGDGAMSQVEYSSFSSTFTSTTGRSLLTAQEDTSSVASLFASVDTDGSATISGEELATALIAASEEDTSGETTETAEEESSDKTTLAADVQAALDAVDANSDGVFDARDVALGVLQAAGEAESKNSTTAKKSADTDGDGIISATERTTAILGL